MVNVEIIRIVSNFVIIVIENGQYKDSIHISQLSEQFNKTIEEVITLGDIYVAKVLRYD